MLPVTGSTVQVPSPLTTTDLPSSAMVLPAGAWVITTLVGSKLLLESLSLVKTLTVTGWAMPPTAVPGCVSLLATGLSCG